MEVCHGTAGTKASLKHMACGQKLEREKPQPHTRPWHPSICVFITCTNQDEFKRLMEGFIALNKKSLPWKTSCSTLLGTMQIQAVCNCGPIALDFRLVLKPWILRGCIKIWSLMWCDERLQNCSDDWWWLGFNGTRPTRAKSANTVIQTRWVCDY